jgi:hypothetical protein
MKRTYQEPGIATPPPAPEHREERPEVSHDRDEPRERVAERLCEGEILQRYEL